MTQRDVFTHEISVHTTDLPTFTDISYQYDSTLQSSLFFRVI